MVDDSRRRFLKLSSLGAATLAAGGALPDTIRKALAIEPERRTGTIEDVEHVVIFMQENRSFDHYFGCLRGVRGFGDPRTLRIPNRRPVWFQPASEHGDGYVLPFHLDSGTTSAQNLKDINHDWKGSHALWQNHDAWVEQKTAMAMGYFQREDIPFYYALADAFTICDGYHASLFGPTNPNRMFLFTGTSGLSAGNDGKQAVDNVDDGNWTANMASDHARFDAYRWKTYAERLQQAGVSWKVYQEYDNFGDNSLQWFAAFRNLDKRSPLYRRGRAWVEGSTEQNARASRGEHLVAAFEDDVRNGTLPQVSWLVAPTIMTEHPEAPPGYGESLSARLLEVLVRHPEVWSRTVFLLNYDENGGFFDHMPPPLPAIDASLGKSTVGTADEDYHGVPVGLGPRVPMLAVSPWSRGGWVNSQVFDHTSVLRFLEARFGVVEPNISAWRRTICGDLTSAFDFAGADPLWPDLPATGDYMARVKAAAGLPAPHVPARQSLPRQEPGQRPARALPYDVLADGRIEDRALTLTMRNRGRAGVALNLYDHAGTQAPRYYTANGGDTLEDSVPLGTAYDVSVFGPNGFMRQFAGRLDDRAMAQVEATLTHAPGADEVIVRLHNPGRGACRVRTTCAYTGRTREQPLAAGASVDSRWPIVAQAHWYDLSVSLDDDPHYRRRFAGHVEHGQHSFSDPAIGSVLDAATEA